MIGIDVLIAETDGLHRKDLQRWIDNDWVRPGHHAGKYVFCEIDMERVRLIQQLCNGIQIDEDALPVVLMLLDQRYELRRRMRDLGQAIEHATTPQARRELARHLNAKDRE